MQSFLPNLSPFNIERPIEGNASFMLAWQLKGKHVVVVGGGREAASRIFFCLDASAKVTVIAPLQGRHPSVQDKIDKGLVQVRDREFQDEDLQTPYPGLENKWAVDMVLSCIDDHEESKRIAQVASTLRIPVNCADIPELCDFYFMAQYRNASLQIAVSTNGGGPRLGARIRNDIVASLNPAIPRAVTCTGEIRAKIRAVDEQERNASGAKALASRMGWVSRFCDMWSYEQLAALEDPRFSMDVLDAF